MNMILIRVVVSMTVVLVSSKALAADPPPANPPAIPSSQLAAERAIAEVKTLLEGAKGDKVDIYRAYLGQLYMQRENYREAVTQWGQVTPAFPKYLDVQEKMCSAILMLYPMDKAVDKEKFNEAQFKTDMGCLLNFERIIKPLADARAATQPDAWTHPTAIQDPAADPLAYRRFRAAQFRLQVGRLTIQCCGQAGLEEGTAILEKVPHDYPDLTNIKLWSNTFLLQGLLDRKEYKKAAGTLMVLIRADQPGGQPSVRRTELALNSVFDLLASDYKRHVAEGHMEDADKVAKQAGQFCEAMLDEARQAGLDEAGLNDITIRKAMTLNWQRKFDEVIGLLKKMCEKDKELARVRHRDPDLSIELADAYRGVGKNREALDLYFPYVDAEDTEAAKANEFDPPIAKYSEHYWRALIGGAECAVGLKEDVRAWRLLLTVAVKGAEARFGGIGPNEEFDPRVPPWLGQRGNVGRTGRLEAVTEKLNQLVPGAKPKAPPPIDSP